jgi:hypothetical protein
MTSHLHHNYKYLRKLLESNGLIPMLIDAPAVDGSASDYSAITSNYWRSTKRLSGLMRNAPLDFAWCRPMWTTDGPDNLIPFVWLQRSAFPGRTEKRQTIWLSPEWAEKGFTRVPGEIMNGLFPKCPPSPRRRQPRWRRARTGILAMRQTFRNADFSRQGRVARRRLKPALRTG